ncbi:16S rRNA (guanine(527)-N(7))-methyltransferase RsmG [Furfurilactobacillus rossiae]|uniref:Ribosomal RNA small subunit methyltransferase G n=1 Tax=Furfurilactobacillus rossiae DSM 15814 TaxID=1114972 RepID=A0A0R1R7F1_9LACO|nr:16S rRNA (guanine(527)-N(7))-methyltransferase RsmG [Furfurilactobacillus rossiae]KRL52975.1 ribosomal rna small subunit methyltransferase g [Furfurilactobacillus rossiae DSM 15814]QFR67567.1 16S rRNA (guanine(527)-N(7))-methyltransferase RsmG [Furfurilactobacillus rossiae]QLE60520.1 rRNA small subunit methyltransferase glucose inhibited division protein GidB [Furfurilactobacillus rossiae]
MNPEQFKTALADHGITLTDQQRDAFDQYFNLLVETNKKFNLTTITAESDVYLKHFYDSITVALFVPELQTQSVTLCDVGAGAGFPSIPLKILFPQLKVTIVDSLNKRINFLQELVTTLGLRDVTLVHDRAETFGARKSPQREQFDYVTGRALARMSVMSELCLPLVKVGGQMLAMKASGANEELTDATYAIHTLGGKVSQSHQFELPVSGDPREIIVLDKVRETPGRYPRRPGTPNKEPLHAH